MAQTDRTLTTEPIDTGDTVKHGPTGETWTGACVEGNRLSWCGWPEGTAALADCTLVEKATPEARQKLLEDWANPVSAGRCDDHRYRYAVRRLEQDEKTDREPPDPDGECYRGREAAGAVAEEQARIQRELKR